MKRLGLFTVLWFIILGGFAAVIKHDLNLQKKNLIDSCRRDNVLRDGINKNKQVFTDFLIYRGKQFEIDAEGDKDPEQRKIDLEAAEYHFALAAKQVRVFRVNCDKAVR